VISNVIVQREWSARFDGAQKTWGPIVEITDTSLLAPDRDRRDRRPRLRRMDGLRRPRRVRWKKFDRERLAPTRRN
jgi:hypothetical protein